MIPKFPIPDSGIPNSEIRMAYAESGIPHHEVADRGAHMGFAWGAHEPGLTGCDIGCPIPIAGWDIE